MLVGAQAAITFGSFFAAFAAMDKWIDSLDGFAKGAVSLAAAIIGIGAAWMITTSILSLGVTLPKMVAAAAAGGVAAAGLKGMASLDSFDDGKKKGEPVPGGMGQLSKDGKRELFGRDGNWVMVDGPTVTDIKSSDTILNNSQTEKVMAGAGSAELLPILTALQATLGELTTAIATAKQTENMQKDNQEIVIKMDARKVADGIYPYALKWPGIRLV
jgi:hypothetical protein